MRPYYVQIRNQKQEVIEELIDYLALDDMIITEPDIKWDEAGVETLNELYIWLKAKKWDKEYNYECGRSLEAIIRMDKIAYPEYWAEA